jgi:hypothetical protein
MSYRVVSMKKQKISGAISEGLNKTVVQERMTFMDSVKSNGINKAKEIIKVIAIPIITGVIAGLTIWSASGLSFELSSIVGAIIAGLTAWISSVNNARGQNVTTGLRK